jgi:hypothetical protein
MSGPMKDELNEQMLVRQQFKNLKTKASDTTFCEGLSRNPQLHSPCYMSGVRVCSLSGKNQLTVCSVWNAGIGDYSRTGDNGCMACPGTIHFSKGPI